MILLEAHKSYFPQSFTGESGLAGKLRSLPEATELARSSFRHRVFGGNVDLRSGSSPGHGMGEWLGACPSGPQVRGYPRVSCEGHLAPPELGLMCLVDG